MRRGSVAPPSDDTAASDPSPPGLRWAVRARWGDGRRDRGPRAPRHRRRARLERFGSRVLDRPAPGEGGFPRRDPAAWNGADARFDRDADRRWALDHHRPGSRWAVAGPDRRDRPGAAPGRLRTGRLLPRAGPDLALGRGSRPGAGPRPSPTVGPQPVRPHRRRDDRCGLGRRRGGPRRRVAAGDRLGPDQRRAQRLVRGPDPLDRRGRARRSSRARPAGTGATTG